MSQTRLVMRPGNPLRGRVRVRGDKSISHRALLLGAIAEGTSRVVNFLPATDCLSTLRVIRHLGVEVQHQASTTLTIRGRGLYGLTEPDTVLDCGRSGTTMRLLSGLLAGQPFLSILSGDPQLRRRPMGRVVEPLRKMGATVLGRNGGHRPPLAVQGQNLHGIDYTLPVASAQVKSALLLAGLYADGPTTLRSPGPSRDHTERMLVAQGVRLQTLDSNLKLTPGNLLRAVDVAVPGDFSSAAYLITAATLIPKSEVTIEKVGVNLTRTGLLDVLNIMGSDVELDSMCQVSGEPIADLTIRASRLRGTVVGGDLVVRAIDELPILAVAATQAQGETLVRDASELRVKETDRISTTVGELRRLGADVTPTPDGFLVRGPTPLRGAVVNSHGDHRLAMALAVAGLVADGETVVQDVDCIADSCPGFEAMLVQLGGRVS